MVTIINTVINIIHNDNAKRWNWLDIAIMVYWGPNN